MRSRYDDVALSSFCISTCALFLPFCRICRLRLTSLSSQRAIRCILLLLARAETIDIDITYLSILHRTLCNHAYLSFSSLDSLHQTMFFEWLATCVVSILARSKLTNRAGSSKIACLLAGSCQSVSPHSCFEEGQRQLLLSAEHQLHRNLRRADEDDGPRYS